MKKNDEENEKAKEIIMNNEERESNVSMKIWNNENENEMKMTMIM